MTAYALIIPGDICTVWPLLANGACIAFCIISESVYDM